MGSYQAGLYHSLTFHPTNLTDASGDKNTWDDWHLVPTSRPKFNMPSIKTQYVDIPGGDGILDLTTALTGRVRYGNRQGSIEFLVMNDYGDWAVRYSNIATYLHGKTFEVTLEDDPLFYYEGRFTVNEWKSEAQWSRIVIDYNVGPFKKSRLSAGERWLWDPFRFVGGTDGKGDRIRTYKNISIEWRDGNNPVTVEYYADAFESSPVFTCRPFAGYDWSIHPIVLTYKSKEYALKQGTNVFDRIVLDEGLNTFVFKGRGYVTIDNTGGRL